MKILRFFLCILLSTLVSCGFHPRGKLPFAPILNDIYLQTSDPYGQLSRNIQQYFKMSGLHVVDTPEKATAILVIEKEVAIEQLLGISGTQQTRQYNLILNVTFSITDSHGKILVPSQALSETRALTIKADQILAGSNEANMLYHQMRSAIVYDIMSRLSSKDITSILTKVD